MATLSVGKPLQDFLAICYKANVPPLLVGRHGVGKSESFVHAAKSLGIQCICRDLSLMEPMDLIGLPRRSHDVTRFLAPEFLPRDGRGILVFEEVNRCEPYMRAPCLQLLSARTLNDYCLPGGWLPAAAINPQEEGYEVSDLDPALRSRFSVANVVPCRKEWLRWAEASGIHPMVRRYVQNDPHIFDDPVSNPRAWKYVSDIVIAAEGQGPPSRALLAALAGCVGDQRAESFAAMLAGGEQPLGPEDVFEDYPKHKARVKSWAQAGRLDLLRTSLMSVMTCLQPAGEYEAVRSHASSWKNLGDFVGDLTADLRERAGGFFMERDYDPPASPRPKSAQRRKVRS